jgi:hypothetical protein
LHKPAIRSKLIMPTILISDTTIQNNTNTNASNTNSQMKLSKTFPAMYDVDKNNNDTTKKENLHELMLPVSAASISKLRSNTIKNKAREAARRPSSLFPLRPPVTPPPLTSDTNVGKTSNANNNNTPTTLTTPTRKSARSSMKSIKSVRINPDLSKEVNTTNEVNHSSNMSPQSQTNNKFGDEELAADDLKSDRTLQSNRSSHRSNGLNRSYSRKSHTSSRSSRNNNNNNNNSKRYSKSSKHASKSGMDMNEFDEGEDEEMIVSVLSWFFFLLFFVFINVRCLHVKCTAS